jgi:hypothetical protein
MLLGFTTLLRLKLGHACDHYHASRASTLLPLDSATMHCIATLQATKEDAARVQTVRSQKSLNPWRTNGMARGISVATCGAATVRARRSSLSGSQHPLSNQYAGQQRLVQTRHSSPSSSQHPLATNMHDSKGWSRLVFKQDFVLEGCHRFSCFCSA